jgi:hypothetical protein
MVEVVVILGLPFGLLDGQLQLTLHSAQEHVVDEDIVVLLVELVLEPHHPKSSLHLTRSIKQRQRVEDVDERRLVALELGPQQVVHLEHNQIDVVQGGSRVDPLACLQQVVYQHAEVLVHDFDQRCVDLGGGRPYLREALQVGVNPCFVVTEYVALKQRVLLLEFVKFTLNCLVFHSQSLREGAVHRVGWGKHLVGDTLVVMQPMLDKLLRLLEDLL